MEVFGPGLLSSSAKLSLSLFFAAPRPPNAGAGGALHDDHVHVSSTTVGTATLPTRSNRGSLLSDAVHSVARGSAARHQLAISLQGQMAADSNSFRAVLAARCAGALLDLQSYITPDERARERADYSLVDNLSADEFRASSRGMRNSSTRLQSRRTSSLGYKDRD